MAIEIEYGPYHGLIFAEGLQDGLRILLVRGMFGVDDSALAEDILEGGGGFSRLICAIVVNPVGTRLR